MEHTINEIFHNLYYMTWSTFHKVEIKALRALETNVQGSCFLLCYLG